MEVDAYLERIAYRGRREPTSETLRRLQRAHLFAVPFENLDIHLGVPIVLSLPALYDKIVERRRGGFCYELNGLFDWLLRELGFGVTRLSARVFQGGGPGPDFDHMLLLVEAGGPWIADVGFGDSFLEPLPLAEGERVQGDRAYRLVVGGDGRRLERRRPGGPWEPQYLFSPTPRRLAEFARMCDYQQTSPESIFRRKVVCSLPTREGRVTVSDGRLIETAAGEREERRIEGVAELRALLAVRFGVVLGEAEPVEKLMSGAGAESTGSPAGAGG